MPDVYTGLGGAFFLSRFQKARRGERAGWMSRVALSHSDPWLQFDPLFLLVGTLAALESSQLKMRAGLLSCTGTSPAYTCTGITVPSRYGAI